MQSNGAVHHQFITHDRPAVFALCTETKAICGGWQIVTDEAMSPLKSLNNHLAVGGEVSTEGLRSQQMGVDGPEMKFIGVNGSTKWTDADVQRMGVRAANGDHFVALRQQIVPARQYLWVGAVGQVLWE